MTARPATKPNDETLANSASRKLQVMCFLMGPGLALTILGVLGAHLVINDHPRAGYQLPPVVYTSGR